ANAGRGWVMVYGHSLKDEDIVNALIAGDFYSSAGVLLDDITISDNQIKVTIKAEPDVAYTTQFIGTPLHADTSSFPIADDNGQPVHISRVYSNEIGQVLFETNENPAIYHFKNDELYIRAKIISNRKHPNPYAEGDFEMAWTQPVVLSTRK
ncbi:MAG TPA: hypothetical protein QGF17_00400, partial [Candidatus Marinimicrobia bacterium]|nr:hypothetical protein [Candidatus Neomarinimicrobiota bacterium]